MKREFNENQRYELALYARQGVDEAGYYHEMITDWLRDNQYLAPSNLGSSAKSYYEVVQKTLNKAGEDVNAIYDAAEAVEKEYAAKFEDIAFEMSLFADRITALRDVLRTPSVVMTGNPLTSDDFAARLAVAKTELMCKEVDALYAYYSKDEKWQELIRKPPGELSESEYAVLLLRYFDFDDDSKEENPLFDAMKDRITSSPFFVNTSLDALKSAVAVYGTKALSMPIFKTVSNSGATMVKIFNSPNYSGGRGGLRFISESNLLNRSDAVGKAFRFKIGLEKVTKGLYVVSGVLGFSDEYMKGADLSQAERVVNATVEGAFSFGTAVGAAAVGAAVGSIVPGAGTVAGAAVGFVVGVAVTVVSDIVVHAKWFDGKSAMDYIKEGANTAVNAIADTGAKAINAIAETGAKLGNAIASWFNPTPAY